MAKSKRPRQSASAYTKGPARWYRLLPDAPSRRQQTRYLRDTVKVLRKLYRGFEAEDGFDARRTHHWSARQRAEVQGLGGFAHSLMSKSFFVARPRSKAQDLALTRMTGQAGIGRKHAQKAYVIHAPEPSVSRVAYVSEKPLVTSLGISLPARLRGEIRRRVKGGETIVRDYLFRDVLGFQPGEVTERALLPKGMPANPWDQMKRALEELQAILPARLRRGKYKGEEAFYSILSDKHGPISSPVPKHALDMTMEDWAERYPEDFVGTIIGVRFQGSRWHAVSPKNPDSVEAKRDRQRQRYQQTQKKIRLARRRKLTGEVRKGRIR